MAKGQPFRLIPQCVITQSSGTQRIIDNADAGGQSALSSDPNKLVLCSPLRPAQHAEAMLDCLDEAGLAEARGTDAVEGGGEDWPDADAYRYCPMDRAASLCCVVARWHATWGEPAFQCSLVCPSRSQASTAIAGLQEALGQRLFSILVSLYFDDSHLTDWASSKGSAQEAFAGLIALGRRLLKQSGSAWQPLAPSWAWVLIFAIACTLGWLSSLSVNA